MEYFRDLWSCMIWFCLKKYHVQEGIHLGKRWRWKREGVCVKAKRICATRLDSCPLTARRTPSAPPMALASLSAAVLTDIMDTSVFERGSFQSCRCLGLLEPPQLWSLSCCGSPRDERPSLSEAAKIHWAETDCKGKCWRQVWGEPRLLLNGFILFYTYLREEFNRHCLFWLRHQCNFRVKILTRHSMFKFLTMWAVLMRLFLNKGTWQKVLIKMLCLRKCWRFSALAVPNLHWLHILEEIKKISAHFFTACWAHALLGVQTKSGWPYESWCGWLHFQGSQLGLLQDV